MAGFVADGLANPGTAGARASALTGSITLFLRYPGLFPGGRDADTWRLSTGFSLRRRRDRP